MTYQSQSIKSRGGDCFFKLPKAIGIMKNEENTTTPKKHSKLPVTEAKEIVTHEFKIIVLKILRNLQ